MGEGPPPGNFLPWPKKKKKSQKNKKTREHRTFQLESPLPRSRVVWRSIGPLPNAKEDANMIVSTYFILGFCYCPLHDAILFRLISQKLFFVKQFCASRVEAFSKSSIRFGP